MIDVLLVEDQAMVRGALSALLETEGDLRVVATAADGREALAWLSDGSADVLVTDIEMPNMDGISLCQAARRVSPQMHVVMLTTFARSGYFRRAMAAGASAYLLKDAPTDALAAAIRSAHAGQKVIDPQLAAEAWSDPDPLTHRERQVLRQAEAGATTQAIADQLGLSEGTVRNYLSSAIGKAQARNRTEAAAVARAKGWL
ncbi:MAG: response regulator transcription factor [Myxococcota bacterium]